MLFRSFDSYDALVAGRPRFDVIWSYQVLIHMTDDIVRSAISTVAPLLETDGRFFATVFLGDRAEGAWMEYPCMTRPLDFYRQRIEALEKKVEILKDKMAQIKFGNGVTH